MKYHYISHESHVERQTLRSQSVKQSLEAKPLPQLPHSWARIRHETSLLFRSIGLGIVPSTLYSLSRKNFKEPTKVAIRSNRVIALLRSLTHAIPLGVALLEITQNWQGRYYDFEFTQLPSYQLIAKFHELTIQASLSLTVLSYIRHQAVLADGLPFGSILGGLQFLQISYLWLVEFWSSIAAKSMRWRRKLIILSLFFTCSILAATVGPSSATLLIPRLIAHPLPPSSFSINGDVQDIWPDRVESTIIAEHCASLSSFEVKSPCPGGPWIDMFHTISAEGSQFDLASTGNNIELEEIHDPIFPIFKTSLAHLCNSETTSQICGTTLQDIVLESAFESISNWRSDDNFGKPFSELIHTFSGGYYQPYTRTSCVSDVITDANHAESLKFPSISTANSNAIQDPARILAANITKTQILEAPGNKSEFRLEWLDLPRDFFGEPVIGAVLLSPTSSASLDPLNITLCTLAGGWGTSAGILSENYGDTFLSSTHDIPAGVSSQGYQISGSTTLDSPIFIQMPGFAYPQRLVTITKGWAVYLNPTIEQTKAYNSTAIHLIVSADPTHLGGIGLPRLLAEMLSYGLARSGIGLNFEASIQQSSSCDNCLKVEMQHTVFGYGYNSEDATTRLTLAVMITYCLVTLAQIIYLGISGISSTAWDSAAEMMTLAVNSSPSKHLENTCAGIVGIKTFQTPIRILATNLGSGKHDHLELVFGDTVNPDANMKRLQMNEKYGKVHRDGTERRSRESTPMTIIKESNLRDA